MRLKVMAVKATLKLSEGIMEGEGYWRFPGDKQNQSRLFEKVYFQIAFDAIRFARQDGEFELSVKVGFLTYIDGAAEEAEKRIWARNGDGYLGIGWKQIVLNRFELPEGGTDGTPA
jgi:hypothetical protein